MARLARAVFGALPHIVVQQAQIGVALLADRALAEQAIEFLDEAATATGTSLHAYSLLDDRCGLLVTPPSAGALGDMMQTWSRRFSVAFNRKHRRSGTLWTGRYRAAVLDPADWMVDALMYVELDPHQGQPALSSLAHHLGQRTDALLTDPAAYWALGNTPFEREARYRSMLDIGLAPQRRRLVDQALRGGWALGSGAFVAQLAEQTSRPLSPRPRGRPRKTSTPVGA